MRQLERQLDVGRSRGGNTGGQLVEDGDRVEQNCDRDEGPKDRSDSFGELAGHAGGTSVPRPMFRGDRKSRA
jgi:hypothetical protein